MALSTISQAIARMTATHQVGKARTGYADLTDSDNGPNPADQVSFALGTGADQINEILSVILTIAASTTTDFDLSAAQTNVVNDALVTLARAKFVSFKLLGVADLDPVGTVLGTACSSVVVGAAAANPFLMFLTGATHTFTLGNGDFVMGTRRSATGMVLTSGASDTLRIQNLDAVNSAKVRFKLYGCAT